LGNRPFHRADDAAVREMPDAAGAGGADCHAARERAALGAPPVSKFAADSSQVTLGLETKVDTCWPS